MKPLSYKRIFAYIIDILIVATLSSMITYFLPQNKEYDKAVEEYTTLIKQFTDNNLDKEEFTSQSNNLVYKINKLSITSSIVSITLTIFYFVVFAYFMNGQTLGKKLMKLKIVSNDRKKLTMNNYLIRSLIVNSVLMNISSIIFILGLSKKTYIKVNDISTYFFGIIYIINFGMILFRDDRRGLHDYLAKTKVISIKDKELNEILEEEDIKNEDSKIKDANIIGEKKLKKSH